MYVCARVVQVGCQDTEDVRDRLEEELHRLSVIKDEGRYFVVFTLMLLFFLFVFLCFFSMVFVFVREELSY